MCILYLLFFSSCKTQNRSIKHRIQMKRKPWIQWTQIKKQKQKYQNIKDKGLGSTWVPVIWNFLVVDVINSALNSKDLYAFLCMNLMSNKMAIGPLTQNSPKQSKMEQKVTVQIYDATSCTRLFNIGWWISQPTNL